MIVSDYEAQHFGFTPLAVVDTIYNISLDSWCETVDKILPMLHLEDIDEVSKKRIKYRLFHLLDRKGILDSLMDKLEKYVTNYIFHIPNHVTLTEDLEQLNIDINHNQEWELQNRIKALEKEILEIRIALEMTRKEKLDCQNALLALKTMKPIDHS